MEKRKTLELDQTYGPYPPEETFALNRSDSIEWARAKFADGGPVRERLSELRTQFSDALQNNFPREVTFLEVAKDDDPNHFLVMLGLICDMNQSPSLRQMGLFFCELLKSEMNLDLHPSVPRPD